MHPTLYRIAFNIARYIVVDCASTPKLQSRACHGSSDCPRPARRERTRPSPSHRAPLHRVRLRARCKPLNPGPEATICRFQTVSSKTKLAIPIPKQRKTPTLNVGAFGFGRPDLAYCGLLLRANLPIRWPCLIAVE
jgi:hypothetical protein